MTSGEGSLNWSMSDFNDMDDQEILDTYSSLVKSLEGRNAALERAMKDNRRG